MIQVLFVCLGNICRSPLAEALFHLHVRQAGLSSRLGCDSAGTNGYHVGERPDPRTRRNAQSHGLELPHRCRLLTADDFDRFDFIIGMDEQNIANIRSLCHRTTGHYPPDTQVMLLGYFDPQRDPDGPVPPVPDPYYQDEEAFEEVYQMIDRCMDPLLAWVTKR